MSIKSQPYFVLDIPTISDIKGTFNYHYFGLVSYLEREMKPEN